MYICHFDSFKFYIVYNTELLKIPKELVVPATVFECGIDNISSNTFLSCLSNNFLNGLHFHLSISDAILNEGIVRPMNTVGNYSILKP